MVPHLKNRADGHLSFPPREGTLEAGDRTDWGRVTARTDPERPIALAGLALPWTLGLAGGAVGDPALRWVVWGRRDTADTDCRLLARRAFL